jgi:hypothetical protein
LESQKSERFTGRSVHSKITSINKLENKYMLLSNL